MGCDGDDIRAWAAILAHDFARYRTTNVPPARVWEQAFARTLTRLVTTNQYTRDQIELKLKEVINQCVNPIQ